MDDKGVKRRQLSLPPDSMLSLWRTINHALLIRTQRWGLPTNAAMVMFRLQVCPEEGEPAILAESTCFPRQTITLALDTLEKHGYAQRVPHPHDRRRKRVVLTESGQRLGAEMLRDLIEFEAAGLAEIPAAEIGRVKEFMTSYAEALKRESSVAEVSEKEIS